jgi:hypothetical protein
VNSRKIKVKRVIGATYILHIQVLDGDIGHIQDGDELDLGIGHIAVDGEVFHGKECAQVHVLCLTHRYSVSLNKAICSLSYE